LTATPKLGHDLAMATCPTYFCYLDEHHRWLGLWRRRARLTRVGVAGALIGVTIRVLIPSAEPIDLVLTGLLGAAVATTVWHVTPHG